MSLRDRIIMVALALLILAVCLMLNGCGTTTDRQTKTVERLETWTGPIQVEIPMLGTAVVQPVHHVMIRSQDEVEHTKKTVDAPEIPAMVAATTGGTPWGNVIATIAGLGVAAFAGKKAVDAGRIARQRDELIDGIERAKDDLGDKWDSLTGHLEAEQSRDTKAAVKARVG